MEMDVFRPKEEFYIKKLEELSICSTDCLKTIARESGIRLTSIKRENIITRIASALTSREFHGWAFWNTKSKNSP